MYEIDEVSLHTIFNFDSKICLLMTPFYTTTHLITSIYIITWEGFVSDSKIIFNLPSTSKSFGKNLLTNFSRVIFNTGSQSY